MALNEASIQYIVSKIYNYEEKYIEAYGIKAKTYGLNKYPLICNMLKQFLFISNEETLIKSTIYSTDDFIIDCVEEIGEASFETIQDNLDELLYTLEELVSLKAKIKKDNEEGFPTTFTDAEDVKKKEALIRRLYMDCQMNMFTVYFDKLYNRIETLEDVEFYRKSLEDYKELIGFATDETQEYFLQYYEKYYQIKEERLTIKEEQIKQKNDKALTVVPENPILQLFNKIKITINGLIKK